MLTNTFLHIPGFCEKTEKLMWVNGFSKWDDVQFGDLGKIKQFLHIEPAIIRDHVFSSRNNLNDENMQYFKQSVPISHTWRMFPEFRKNTAYLDIETTGLSSSNSNITTISVYDGKDIRYYVRGRNLTDFVNDIKKYKMIVTFNGRSFDIPFIEHEFGIRLDHGHIDLRYVLKSLGYKGGLKSCEKQLGICRDELEGVDGYFAVLLWENYLHNSNEKALETLLAYNIEDVINLESLMIKAYNMKIDRTPFAEQKLKYSDNKPQGPFQPDLEIIEKLKRGM